MKPKPTTARVSVARFDTVKVPVPFSERLSEWWFQLRLALTSFPPGHWTEWKRILPGEPGYETAEYEAIADLPSRCLGLSDKKPKATRKPGKKKTFTAAC